jgi:hypothetical protein
MGALSLTCPVTNARLIDPVRRPRAPNSTAIDAVYSRSAAAMGEEEKWEADVRMEIRLSAYPTAAVSPSCLPTPLLDPYTAT